MNKVTQLIISVVLSVLATYALVQGSMSRVSAPRESVYERVMRTGILRCGYFPEAPLHHYRPEYRREIRHRG